VVGQAEVDPGHRALVALGKGNGPDVVRRQVDRRGCHDELRVPPPQPQLDRTRRQLAGDLLGGRGQHVLQGEADGGVERGDEPLGQRPGIVTARLGGHRQLAMDVLDIRPQVHDAMMMP
jgi:hypothetical protein